jgi:hypothetical protein
MSRSSFGPPARSKFILALAATLVVLVGVATFAQAGTGPASKRVTVGAKGCDVAINCRVGAEVPLGSPDSLRFNIGGGDIVDHTGARWSGIRCDGGERYTAPSDIAGTTNDELFQSRQFEPTCELPVAAGRYVVTVGWAETYNARAGYRKFVLRIEGMNVALVDVGAAAGMNRTLLTDFVVDVKGGTLDVNARQRKNRPMLALVMATPIGGGSSGSTASPTVTAAPSTTTDATTTTAKATTTTARATTTTARATTTTARATTTTARATTTTAKPTTTTAKPTTTTAPTPPPAGTTRTVGSGQSYATLQAALDAAQPGDTVRLAGTATHRGPAISKRDGQSGKPITITADAGATLQCSDGRCLEIVNSYYVIDGLSITGGTSNLYVSGASAGKYVHDVVVRNSTFRGNNTGECIRVKYQAYAVEIANNDIADCGKGRYGVGGSKNGEGVYIGTAPEQLSSKNPSSEADRTHDVWVHHNVIKPYNECVDIKEAAHDNVIEYNT